MDREHFFEAYGISTLPYTRSDLVRGLEIIARVGFRWVELCKDQEGWLPSFEPRPADLRAHLAPLGLQVHGVHAPFANIGIGHLDRSIADRAVRLVCEAVECCAEIGGSVVVVHVSEKHYVVEGYEESVKVSRDLVYRANEVARHVGVKLVLENLVPYHRPHPRYGSSLVELVREFPEPEIGFCLDTGHAVLTGLNQKKEIEAASPRLLSVHAASNDGRSDTHQLPTTGVVNWVEVEEGLAAIRYAHRLIIEVQPGGDPDAVVGQAAELWRHIAGGPYGPGTIVRRRS